MIALDQPIITTPRLTLRPWRESDLVPFAAMNADPQVMRHFPKLLTREECDAAVDRFQNQFGKQGFSIFAVELSATRAFIGSVGLTQPLFESHFTPCVEIGWRIRRESQCRGYATEAARALLRFGFETLNLNEIVSFTVPANQSSWTLMERLGMTRNPSEDFDHPRVPKDHPLCRHILYRLTQSQWRTSEAQIFDPNPQPQYGRRIAGRTYIIRPGSYAIIQNDAGQFAIVQTTGGIGLPGGGADSAESPQQTLQRELLEETGRRVLIHRQIGESIEFVHSTREGDFEKHCTFFHASFDPSAPPSPPEPGTQILWLAAADAIAVLTHESHRWAIANVARPSASPVDSTADSLKLTGLINRETKHL
jgi:RimJ/RimL family protein N-acetyltransferase/8-oxo-dGTP pyrophosphatase MutT (NUDIX family)